MKKRTLFVITALLLVQPGCTSKKEPAQSPEVITPSPSETKREISPEELKNKIIKLTPKRTPSASIERLPFDVGAEREGMRVEGTVTDGLRWRDSLGENVVLFSRAPIAAKPTEEMLGDEGPGRALYATHYLSPKAGGPPVRKRVVKDRYESCGFDLVVRFLKRSFAVTDLDSDGVGEVSFGYVVDCTSDLSPLTIKLLMLEDGAKYILRGESRIQVGEDKWTGGVFKVDQSFTLAPTDFLIHAGNLWMKINTLQ